MNATKLVAELKDMGDKVRCLKEMKSDQNKRSQEFWREFHNDHYHKNSDYKLLRGKVDRLLKEAHLKELFSEKKKL